MEIHKDEFGSIDSLYQMGSPSEGITALCLCKSSDVNHFDKEGRNLYKMRCVMKVVEHFAKTRSVWKPLTAGPDYWMERL